MEAKIDNYSKWVNNTDEQYLKEYFNELLTASGFGLEGILEKQFEPQGYSAIWLLSESHFAIHTFPEAGRTYIELSSCVSEPFDVFVRALNL